MLGSYDIVLVTLYCGLQLLMSKTNRIGDTKYHISCTSVFVVTLNFTPMLMGYSGCFQLTQHDLREKNEVIEFNVIIIHSSADPVCAERI